jgi:hypothetical protein
MTPENEKLLADAGWVVECESPLEIAHPDGSRATGSAALAVLRELSENVPDCILPGQVWRELDTGRLVRILEEEVHGTGPAWTYIDATGNDVPESKDHGDWFWHYCDVADFFVWKRFQFVRQGEYRPLKGGGFGP